MTCGGVGSTLKAVPVICCSEWIEGFGRYANGAQLGQLPCAEEDIGFRGLWVDGVARASRVLGSSAQLNLPNLGGFGYPIDGIPMFIRCLK